MYREEREPLKKGEILTLGGSDIRIESCIGKGTTCLAYRGILPGGKKGLKDMPVIIKEFYPQSRDHLFHISRQKNRLEVSSFTKEDSEYQKRLAQFEKGYENQWNLSCSESVMELMVRPHFYSEWGDSFYAVTNLHAGLSMDQVHFSGLEEKLTAGMAIADMLQILHGAGYMLVDFKPENMLWLPQTKKIKLFDADSVLDYRNLREIHAESVRFNDRYASPQIRLLSGLVKRDSSEFERKKQLYLKPAADIYSAGLILFEMLFGCLPGEGEVGPGLAAECLRFGFQNGDGAAI